MTVEPREHAGRVIVALAGRFQAQLRGLHDLRNYRLLPTASIGIVVGPEQLLQAADMTMCRAQGTGKGNHMVFDPSVPTVGTRGDALRRGCELAQIRAPHGPSIIRAANCPVREPDGKPRLVRRR